MADDVELQLNGVVRRIMDLLEQDTISRPLMQSLGQFAVDRIRLRTRLGYGVPENQAARVSLKIMRQHSEGYRQWRKENADKLSDLTKPTKHNLTLSGQMLEQLGLTEIKSKDKRLTLGFKNDFAREKAEINTKRGWVFMKLSDIETKGLLNLYKRQLRELVIKFNS